jgi:purine-binding chemotaxis protein CheW
MLMSGSLLFFRVASRACALPVNRVEETMRPPPIEPIPDAPSFLAGVSIIRGAPTPMLDLGAYLSGTGLESARRAIVVRTDDRRRVALLVSQVLGIGAAEEATLSEMPPLLGEAAHTAIQALGRLDEQLLAVLHLGHVVPDRIWRLLMERVR